MKKALFVLVLGLLAYWGSQNKTEISDEWERRKADGRALMASLEKKFSLKEIPSDNAEDSASATDSETPAGTEKNLVYVPPPAPEPLPELPEGVYYTKERLTMMMDGGIKAIAIATKVTKVGEEKDLFVIDDGHTKLTVGPWKLTRDPKEVAKLRQTHGTK
jgi:hypothetical protein